MTMTVTGTGTGTRGEGDADRQPAGRNARGRRGMIVAPHGLAAEAGHAVLKAGGNAIEALIAAGSALAVVYPHFCGLGGDAVWMLSDARGDVTSLLGIGQAAENVSGVTALPPRGPASTLTSACLVDGWGRLLDLSRDRWGGAQTLSQLLEPAILLADEGFVVSPSQRFWWDFRAAERASWPGFEARFVGQGLQRQPALARTLKRIAAHGPREFYEGALAAEIAAGLAAVGSPLTARDLASTEARFETPLRLAYRDLMLYAPPPPTQGVTTLGIMGLLAHFAPDEMASEGADFYHHLVEAVKQAFLDRGQIADPDFVAAGAFDPLLDPARLAAKAEAVNPQSARPWPDVYRHGDTAFLAAVDAEGRSACVLQSLYYDWGSGVMVGDTGLLWQNRGAGFSLDPASPNRLQPGKRPFYTLNPGLALRNGRPHLLYGTQGADGQPQTLALLLSLLIDHGLDPAEALSRPRFLLGRTFSDGRDTLKLERNAGEDVVAGLSSRGHIVSMLDHFSPLGGQAGIIRMDDDGVITGAHDPRSDGGAIAL
ncbi:gamma-glutamyltranspeptidase / glutathione hydrolase [Rhizobium sp. RU35A]|uniref:gamma-glutamyltransferase family protein n=1 Tax=Rhizobium sp. RU35A TaxID=1907414 RepID=UPI000955F864|nr:gamma-glutamyltranspeptidase / glutathione hydrolase [Rhizobium sp. RU35A]